MEEKKRTVRSNRLSMHKFFAFASKDLKGVGGR